MSAENIEMKSYSDNSSENTKLLEIKKFIMRCQVNEFFKHKSATTTTLAAALKELNEALKVDNFAAENLSFYTAYEELIKLIDMFDEFLIWSRSKDTSSLVKTISENFCTYIKNDFIPLIYNQRNTIVIADRIGKVQRVYAAIKVSMKPDIMSELELKELINEIAYEEFPVNHYRFSNLEKIIKKINKLLVERKIKILGSNFISQSMAPLTEKLKEQDKKLQAHDQIFDVFLSMLAGVAANTSDKAQKNIIEVNLQKIEELRTSEEGHRGVTPTKMPGLNDLPEEDKSHHTAKALNAFGNDRSLAQHKSDPHYWYSVADVFVIISDIRSRMLQYDDAHVPPNPAEPHSSFRQNKSNAFVSNPYCLINLATSFEEDCRTLLGTHVKTDQNDLTPYNKQKWNEHPSYMLISFLAGGHWRIVRIKMKEKKISLLWDDPMGDKIDTTFYNNTSDIIFNIIKRNFFPHIPDITCNKIIKTLVQQPQDNAWDCGPIILKNLEDYLRQPKVQNAKFQAVPNKHYSLRNYDNEGMQDIRKAHAKIVKKSLKNSNPIDLSKLEKNNLLDLINQAFSSMPKMLKKVDEYIDKNETKDHLLAHFIQHIEEARFKSNVTRDSSITEAELQAAFDSIDSSSKQSAGATMSKLS